MLRTDASLLSLADQALKLVEHHAVLDNEVKVKDGCSSLQNGLLYDEADDADKALLATWKNVDEAEGT